jgi:FixJ family two-component response regulator
MAEIVVADDETSLRNLLGRFLERMGHKVRTAASAQEALALLVEAPCDVLISDINMPGASGLHLLEAVSKQFKDTKVVLMTGLPTVEGASEALMHGVFSYQVKPVQFAVISRIVEQAAEVKVLEETQRILARDAEQRSMELLQVQEQIRDQRARMQDPLSPLIEASRESGMGEMATRMMHFVGNILNHAATSHSVMASQCSEDVIENLRRLRIYIDRISEGDGDAQTPADPRLRAISRLVEAITGRLVEQRKILCHELSHLENYLAEATTHLHEHAKPGSSRFIRERCDLRVMIQDWIDCVSVRAQGLVTIGFESCRDSDLCASRYVVREALFGLLDFFLERALLSSRTVPHQIHIQLARDAADNYRLHVHDDGQRLAHDEAEAVFRPNETASAVGSRSKMHNAAIAIERLGGVIHSDFSSADAKIGLGFDIVIPRECDA